MKKLFTLFAILIIQQVGFGATPSKNDLNDLFINNRATIYTINMRTFSAKDNNNNDVIEEELGESVGNFISGVERLDEIKDLGFNTIYLLPITKTGKLKALGTAGSLYAMDSFNEISPYLDKKYNNLTVEEEAEIFIHEAHERGLNVILDLPSCGSYDFSLAKPSLFLKNKKGLSITPADWADVRLFKVYDEDKKLNQELISGFKSFIEMAQKIGANGVRADVAAIKPKEFWAEIISYAKEKDPNFLFIAEASTSWKNPAKPHTDYENVKGLLNAGFDGYYTDFSNFYSIKTKKDFKKKIKTDRKLIKKFKNKKSQMITLATHDQKSPVFEGGKSYWQKVLWFGVTYPKNTYFLDGFQSGDDYNYKFENKKAYITSTDDDYYFVHKGQFDIFNFSRQPKSEHNEFYEEFKRAMSFNKMAKNIIADGKFRLLKTNSNEVLAYSTEKNKDSVVTIMNLNKEQKLKAEIKIKKMNKKRYLLKINGTSDPTIKRGKIIVELEPNEVQVFVYSKERI